MEWEPRQRRGKTKEQEERWKYPRWELEEAETENRRGAKTSGEKGQKPTKKRGRKAGKTTQRAPQTQTKGGKGRKSARNAMPFHNMRW